MIRSPIPGASAGTVRIPKPLSVIESSSASSLMTLRISMNVAAPRRAVPAGVR